MNYPMLDLLRLPGKKAFSTTKIVVLLAGVLLAGTLAWFLVPLVFTLFSSTIPILWTSLRSSTAPPYLFIAVNFIILTIWKLSENRALHTDRLPEEESPFNPDVISLRSRDPVSSHTVQLLRRSSPEDFGKSPEIPAGNAVLPDSAGVEASPAPESESSCLTTVSEEKSTASSSNGFLIPESALTDLLPEGKEETDSIDATWNAIKKKSDRWERSAPPPQLTVGKRTVRVPATDLRGENSFLEGKDEINQRFDDFIKKNYDQIRLRKPG